MRDRRQREAVQLVDESYQDFVDALNRVQNQ
jgi:hypothetical protein